MQKITYRIATIDLQLEAAKGWATEDALPSFASFRVIGADSSPAIRVMLAAEQEKVATEGAQLLSDVSAQWGDRFSLYETENSYITVVSNETKDSALQMVSNKDFSLSTIYRLGARSEVESSILSWMLMVAFGQGSLCHGTVLIHASVVQRDGAGYAFLGKSGTGKSTHSRLWMDCLEGFDLLNDDNPAMQLGTDGQVRIFGTPWSGKTPCYRNMGVGLKGIVRLQQGRDNVFRRLKGKEALIQVLPSCTALRWNEDLYGHMVSIVANIVQGIPVGLLSCRPDPEAALICYENIVNNKII